MLNMDVGCFVRKCTSVVVLSFIKFLYTQASKLSVKIFCTDVMSFKSIQANIVYAENKWELYFRSPGHLK